VPHGSIFDPGVRLDLHRRARDGARQRQRRASGIRHLGEVRHRSEVVEYRVEQLLAQMELAAKKEAKQANLIREAERLQADMAAYTARLRQLPKASVSEVNGAKRGDKRGGANQRQSVQNQQLTREPGAG
jgi:hypothetical protein